MNILLLTAHSIAEFDDLRMFHEMGHQVLSIGAYLNPAEPADDKRPALPQVPAIPELAALVADQMVAKSDLPDAVLDWADTVICHHFPAGAPDGRPGWLYGPNWAKFKAHRNRVIWRTCGQSNPAIEQVMAVLRRDGLEIVRYSPKERNLPFYAGEDAVIRFGKEPDEWCGWTGDPFLWAELRSDPWEDYPEDQKPFIGNVTQNMAQRGDACGYDFWKAATKGLEVLPAGPGSDVIGGVGSLAYDEMRVYLRSARVYLYTGTQPASYTLGLIEAMMTGVPVVSIGPKAFGPGWIGEVFEGHELVDGSLKASDDPAFLNRLMRGWYLDDRDSTEGIPQEDSKYGRQRAIDLFGMEARKAEWAAFLDA